MSTKSPLACPACGSDNTIAGEPYWDAETVDAHADVECHDCGHEWTLNLVISPTN